MLFSTVLNDHLNHMIVGSTPQVKARKVGFLAIFEYDFNRLIDRLGLVLLIGYFRIAIVRVAFRVQIQTRWI